MSRRWIALVTVVLCLVLATAVEACPTCKSALGNQQRYGNLPQAYMYSILFMMSMPFLLLGSFSAYMYYQIRQHRRRSPNAGAAQPAVVEPLDAAHSNRQPETAAH